MGPGLGHDRRARRCASPVCLIAFGPAGFLLLGQDGVLWRYADGQLHKQVLPLPSKRADTAFLSTCTSGSGERMYVSTHKLHVLLDARQGTELKSLASPVGEVSVDCVDGGDALVVHDDASTGARILSMQDGEPVAAIASGQEVASVRRLVDERGGKPGTRGERVATLSKTGRLALWSLADGRAGAAIDEVASIQHATDDVLWTQMTDGAAVAWQLPGLTRLGQLQLPGGESIAQLDILVGGGARLKSAKGRRFRSTLAEPYQPVPVPGTEEGQADKIVFNLSSDGNRLLRAGPAPNDLTLLDAETDQVIRKLETIATGGHSRAEASVGGGKADGDGASPKAPPTSRYRQATEAVTDKPADAPDTTLSFLTDTHEFSSSGRIVMQKVQGGRFRVWDAKDGALLLERPPEPKLAKPKSGDGSGVLDSEIELIGDTAISVLGKTGAFELWSIPERRRLSQASGIAKVEEMPGPGATPLLLIGGQDGTVKVVDPITGTERWSDKLGSSAIQSLAMYGRTELVVAVAADGTVGIWPAAGGPRVATIEHGGQAVQWSKLDLRSDRLWTLTADRQLHGWSLAGQPIGRFALEVEEMVTSRTTIDKAVVDTDLSRVLFERDNTGDARQWWLWIAGPATSTPDADGSGQILRPLSDTSPGDPASTLGGDDSWTLLRDGRLIERDSTSGIRLRKAAAGEAIATLLPGQVRPGARSDALFSLDTKQEKAQPTAAVTADDQDVSRQRGQQGNGPRYASQQFRALASGETVHDIPSDATISQARFSDDGALLLITTVAGVVRIIDAATSYTLVERQGAVSAPSGLALTLDASAFKVTFADGVTRYWRAAPATFERRPTAVELVAAARAK